MQAESERKAIFGGEACKRKKTAGRKGTRVRAQVKRACMEDLTTLGLGFL
jgi:hypothetical protein